MSPEGWGKQVRHGEAMHGNQGWEGGREMEARLRRGAWRKQGVV